jgi:hypothetical protein
MIDTDARNAITEAKNLGELVLVHLADGTSASGTPISVNSKGVNIKMEDGKTRSFSLTRVKAIDIVTDDDEAEYDALDDVPEDIAEMLHDGMTTSDLADIMGTTPKALRVSLRALGMGVGKGRKYSLTPTAYIAVRNHLAEVPAAS